MNPWIRLAVLLLLVGLAVAAAWLHIYVEMSIFLIGAGMTLRGLLRDVRRRRRAQ